MREDLIITKLKNRSVISVRGPDATSFLQNIITQDMKSFKDYDGERAALFTGFLNVKGRILMDGIIVKPKLAG